MRRILPTSILLAALIAAPLAPFARAADRFTFHGSGWGHGIGLSQYGALGLAQEGWAPVRILKHYYTGVRVQRRDPPRDPLRVGLLQYRGRVTVNAQSGPLDLALSNGTHIETLASGRTRVIEVVGGRFRIETPTGELVGDRLWGSSTRHLQVLRADGSIVRVPEWGHRAGRGMLELRVAGSGTAHLVAVLDPEEYLYGLGEVPSSWPMAALKAQAMAARTYAYQRAAGGRTGCACHILGDTRDQAYVGWDKEVGTDGDRWVRSVVDTSRRVVLHHGEPIATLYSSSSGGYTENVETVWGGAAQPYLKGVCDPGDFTSSNPNRTWEVSLSSSEVAARLRSGLGWSVARVGAIKAVRRGVSGRLAKVRVEGRAPGGGSFSATTSGWGLRGALGLKDTRVWVNADRSVTGAIRREYDRIVCRPGLPTGPQRGLAGGVWQRFQRGRILQKGAVAAWIRKPILPVYLRRGGPGGSLGYPVSQQTKLQDGRVRVRFEGGTITCRSGGACSVRT
ncbi:MAG TPA: SpoIID/LytB domain-containing protein [Actinomycetota bacterium]|nr:SpoIID/LytB domain-containing protein [Actinomycetota bacterium]